MREFEKQKLHGWDKFIYNLYMILTFPVRRWWVLLSIMATVLLVLIIIPTLHGIKKDDIFDWYKAKWAHSDLNYSKNKTLEKLNRKINKIKEDILPDSTQSKSSTKEESDLVAWNVAEFRKAKYIPNPSEQASSGKKVHDTNTYALIKEQIKKQNKESAQTQQTDNLHASEPQKTAETPETDEIYYDIRPDLNLEYLDKPETISGSATVTGANELYIGDTFVYLYGIYTSPRKYNINEVKTFLEEITANQTVECDVVAYSKQTQAKTALCFVNGVLINKQMVSENFADNIALKME